MGFRTFHRTEIQKFVQFLKNIVKIPMKLPLRGALYSDEEVARILNSDPRTVRKYYEVVEGVDLNGRAACVEADSRVFIYRDDPFSLPLTQTRTSARITSEVKTQPFVCPRCRRGLLILIAPHVYKCDWERVTLRLCPTCGKVHLGGPLKGGSFTCPSCGDIFTPCPNCGEGWAHYARDALTCVDCGLQVPLITLNETGENI